MTSLSFENLSSEHLGIWYPIKLKLSPTQLHYKNEKTSKSYHFESNQIKTAEWLYRARGYGLCIKLTSKKRYYFDGFAENEFEKLSKYFEESYGVKVKNVETCLKGWNWGKPKFEGEHMEFLIDGMRGFDINLKDVINANLSKNELTLQFQTSDEALSIFEMRFATLSTNDSLMNEIYQQVVKEANILEANEDALTSLKEMHCLQPRGRYEIKLYPQFIHLRGKTYDYSVPKDNFIRFFLLPHPDERQLFFVIQVDPPITHGQTRYHFIILLFDGQDDISIDLNCEEQWLNETYNSALNMHMSGSTYEVITKLFKTLYQQKLTVPTKFQSKHKSHALTCSYKTTTGFLYPLDRGFIFVPKPALSIPSDEIISVNLSRTMQRTFDFDIETSSGTVHTFTAIDKSEYNVLLEFVRSKKYVLSGGNGGGGHIDRDGDVSGMEDEEADEYLERMKAEGRRRIPAAGGNKPNNVDDDDDDEEEDADFDPEAGAESSVAEEYDSEVSNSSSDDSDGSGGAPVAKEPVRPIKVVKKEAANIDTKEPVMPTNVAKKAAGTKETVVKKQAQKRPAEPLPKKPSDAVTKKASKKPKDPNAPKKPMTAYFLFAREYREEAKKTVTSVGDIAKVTGEKWKTMTDSDKVQYNDQYKVLAQKYQEEMKIYKQSNVAVGFAAGASSKANTKAAVQKPVKIGGEIVGKLSTGVFKSEEFVASDSDTD